MPFLPGNKLGKGRPRGSKNKRTGVNEVLIQSVITASGKFILKNMEDLQYQYEDSDSLAIKGKIIVDMQKTMADLMAFMIPKLSAAKLETDFDRMDDETLEILVSELTSKVIETSNQLKIVNGE